jgi:cytochrome c-type biogenesis protein CcmH/NrfG
MYARALLAYDPNHLEGLVVLGSIYERNEMLEDALESYERAVHVSKGDASIRLHVERIKAELSQR